jgi:hypothetical protein
LQGFARPIRLVSLNFAKFLLTHLGGSKVKTLRQISAVTILSLTLAVSVMAGQTDTTGAPAPAPTPTSTTTQTTSTTTAIVLTVLGLIYP